MAVQQFNCRGKVVSFADGPVIMGILNVTPDSFSDGGKFIDAQVAVEHGLAMAADGAGMIDVGGESTRPGSRAVPSKEQIRRVVPVIEGLAARISVPISIDATSSKVAAAALAAGASVINDVSALRFDSEMAAVAAENRVSVVLMHMLGEPGTMQVDPTYVDVVKEVKEFLAERISYAVSAGIATDQLVVDPGIGFGKTLEHNLALMKNLAELHSLGPAMLVGPSRKAFIGKVLGLDDPTDRVFGTAAAVARCVEAGVQIIRVHDVKAMVEVARMAAAMKG